MFVIQYFALFSSLNFFLEHTISIN